MADLDLQIRGRGGAIIPDLEISGGRPVSKKIFSAFLNFRVFIVRDTKIGMRPRWKKGSPLDFQQYNHCATKMQIVPACKSQGKSKNSWDNSVLFILTDQVIATSQNKWKEGLIKSAENWKQIWINSALKFKCSTKWLKIKCQLRRWISETTKISQ